MQVYIRSPFLFCPDISVDITLIDWESYICHGHWMKQNEFLRVIFLNILCIKFILSKPMSVTLKLKLNWNIVFAEPISISVNISGLYTNRCAFSVNHILAYIRLTYGKKWTNFKLLVNGTISAFNFPLLDGFFSVWYSNWAIDY